jgi:hypothetical protein
MDTTINTTPKNPDKSRTVLLETAESTSAPKSLNLPPVMATSSKTPPKTSNPIMTLWGIDQPFSCGARLVESAG